MEWQITGLGNALMDALVIIDDDTVLDELGLVKGTMHPVDHDRWQQVFDHLGQQKITYAHGGSCANTIATAARLGCRTLYCGQVGDDDLGLRYASLMEEACGGHRLRVATDGPTGKCLSIVSRADAERTMVTNLGVAVRLPELGDFAEVVTRTSVAHFTGYTLLDGPMRAVAEEGMRLAHAAGVQVSIDGADPFVVELVGDLIWKLLTNYGSIAFFNEDEARSLTQREAPEAVRHIAERAGLHTVVVKLGGRGSLVWSGGQVIEVPIHPVQAIDTTGAGDAYAGGYLYGHVQGWSPTRCGHIATTIAGLTVAQLGAVVSNPEALAAARLASP